MSEVVSILVAVLFPIFVGVALLCAKGLDSRRDIHRIVGIALVAEVLLALLLLRVPEKEFVIFRLTEGLPIAFQVDGLGKVFVVAVAAVWAAAGFYSFPYMEQEGKERRYFGFYLIAFGVLVGLGCAGNLVTMYAFFELTTLATFPLVIHSQSREAIMAALKYLFYSFCGAYMALFGLFFLCRHADSLSFVPGGGMGEGLSSGQEPLLLLVAFLMILGFGAKAGLFPMHAWLPAAHPVAPAPASAALSGIIAKAGAFAIARTVFYVFGADFLRGTWVQYAFLALSLLTVFMGSMLAFHEKVLKKRLAYSTVSQVSYVLVGFAFLSPGAFTGALLQLLAHAFAKSVLFFAAGAIIHKTGITAVDGLTGIGKRMPVTMWCFTFAALGLVGIPPTGGFLAKWYLAAGALDSGAGVFCYLGPAVLLISALLTAGYLLPITMKGFFPGAGFSPAEGVPPEGGLSPAEGLGGGKCEVGARMLVPMLVLAALSVVVGLLPGPLLPYLSGLADALM